MNALKITLIFILFVTIHTRTGQSDGCYCRRPDHTGHCLTPGCSNGTNSKCNTGKFFENKYAALGLGSTYRGCNCPGNPFNVAFNAFYNTLAPIYTSTYNYTNCTDFGSKARTSESIIPADANAAIHCCNYCCGRHDPYISWKPIHN